MLQHTGKISPFKAFIHGELFAFANDLDRMYGNNMGAIDVTVWRVV